MATIMTQNNFPSGSSTKKIEKTIDNTRNFLEGKSSSTTTFNLAEYDIINGDSLTTTSIISHLYVNASSSVNRTAVYFPMSSSGSEVSNPHQFINSSFVNPKTYTIPLKGLSNITDPYNQDMIISINSPDGAAGMYYYNGSEHQIMDTIQHRQDAPHCLIDGIVHGVDRSSITGYSTHLFDRASTDCFNGWGHKYVYYDDNIFNSLYYCNRSKNIEDMTKNHILLPALTAQLAIDRFYSTNSRRTEWRVDMDIRRTLQIPINNPITESGELNISDFFVGLVEGSYTSGNPTSGVLSDMNDLWAGANINDHMSTCEIEIRLLPMSAKIISGSQMRRFSRSGKEIDAKILGSFSKIESMSLTDQHMAVQLYVSDVTIDETLRIQDSIFHKDVITFDDVIQSSDKFYTDDMIKPRQLMFVSDRSSGDNYVIVSNADAALYRLVKYEGQVYSGYIFNPKFKQTKRIR